MVDYSTCKSCQLQNSVFPGYLDRVKCRSIALSLSDSFELETQFYFISDHIVGHTIIHTPLTTKDDSAG